MSGADPITAPLIQDEKKAGSTYIEPAFLHPTFLDHSILKYLASG
jgi:hypothetical protein